ncbi:DUF1972 domain-containing protein [Marinagarivorans algicola]|uniref:DUF1972 domain-containing protein n=1 Tax=Marinagarivorans algicola TaxID=1513270 RepID=UPI00373521FC
MVAIIGTVGVPACYGGFETLVENILDGDGEYTVYCSSKSYDEKLATYKGANLVYLPINANGISSVFYDGLSMLHALIKGHKVILTLGVSAGLLLPFIRLFTRRKLVTNIDGLEWRRDKWSSFAKWYLKVSERAAVKYSHEVIADNQGIADYVYSEYGIKPRVIAYGGDHVLVKPVSGTVGDYAFGLCRIEPENNVHLILEAFSKTAHKLKFVGNWDASEYGVKLKLKYSSYKNIQILDPIYDVATLFDLRDHCNLYVHGHSAGGTNPSLVEAMFFNKPIIAFDCIYNRATMDNVGFFFQSSAELGNLIANFKADAWDEIGIALGRIAGEKYRWEHIRNEYSALIKPKATN